METDDVYVDKDSKIIFCV